MEEKTGLYVGLCAIILAGILAYYIGAFVNSGTVFK